MTRRTACAAAALVVLGLVSACSGSDDEPSSRATGSADCAGGDISVLQGQPADLPGGGQVGIGDVDADADPPRVRLVFTGDGVPTEHTTYTVGDTFSVGSTSYRVDCLSAGKVALSEG